MWEKAWICRHTHTHTLTHTLTHSLTHTQQNFDTKYKERIKLQATLEEHAISLKKILYTLLGLNFAGRSVHKIIFCARRNLFIARNGN